MKPLRRLKRAMAWADSHRAEWQFDQWLARQPGNVRRAPRAEQDRQFKAWQAGELARLGLQDCMAGQGDLTR